MIKTIPFYGLCSANGELTLVSSAIGHPFRILRIRAKFAAGVANEMTLRFYLSDDDEAPTTGRPSGVSILEELGQVDYLTGEDEVVEIDHEIKVAHSNSWVKVWADNLDFNPHAVSVQIKIDTEPRV